MTRLWVCGVMAAIFLAGCSAAASDPGILFLRPGPNGSTQLYLLPPDGSSDRQLTGVDEPAAPEVIDFAAAPDGKRIVYSTADGAGDSALRITGADGRGDRLLVDCPAAECFGPVWSPDGRRLIYEERPLVGGVLGSPRLHWLDPGTGDTRPLIEGNETPGYGARFSPDGAWLSYVSPSDDGIVLYRPADGAQRLLTSRVGRPASWSPDSASIIISDIVVDGHATAPEAGEATPVQESAAVYLYRADVAGEGNRTLLSPQSSVDDSAPAWSPDGEWIAFTRAPAGTAAGRQLWLMRPDGSEARALTADPAIAHGPPQWSPDGRYLLYQRYSLSDPAARPSVWRLDVATGEAMLVAEDGYLPGWTP